MLKYLQQFKHNCPTCDFGGDSEEDLKKHTCSKTKYHFSESEDSLQFSSEQESEDSDANCELLEEELEKPQKNNTKKKKHSDSSEFLLNHTNIKCLYGWMHQLIYQLIPLPMTSIHFVLDPATAFLPFPVKNTQTYLAESAEDL